MIRHLVILVLSLLAAVQTSEHGHFAYVGSLSAFMAPGAKIAPVTSGLGFDIVLTEDGKSIAGPPFMLQIPGADKPVVLNFKGATYSGGHLTADVSLPNATSTAIEGIRLDIVNVTETYNDKDAQGQSVTKTRAQNAALSSPVSFGDIGPGADNGAIPFDLPGIAFTADTTKVVVHGVISGVRYISYVNVPDTNGVSIDIDAQGRVYVAGGDDVKRVSADRKSVETFVKEEANFGVGIDPANQDVLTVSQNRLLTRYGSDGKQKVQWDAEKQGFDWLTLGLRVAKDGRLCTSGDNQRNIQCISAQGRKLWTATTTPTPAMQNFDIAADGTVYAAADIPMPAVYAIDTKGALKTVVSGQDWKLGRLTSPVGLRVGPTDGWLYVLEKEREPNTEDKILPEEARISVFDKTGAFVRVFGRGARVPKANGALPGGLAVPTDLVFGAGGMIHVLTKLAESDESHVLMTFQVF